MTTTPTNRDRLNASYDRLRSALARTEKAERRRGLTGQSASRYDHAIKTNDSITTSLGGDGR